MDMVLLLVCSGSAHIGVHDAQPDPRADGLSINDYCARLPRRRYTHQAHGLILQLPRTGLDVFPFREHKGGWDAVVVEGHGAYPVGGYDVYIPETELETAIKVRFGEEVPGPALHGRDCREAGGRKLNPDPRPRRPCQSIIDSQTRWGRNSFGKKVSVSTEEIAGEFPVVVTTDKGAASV